jgi:lysophospholipase L1-like esterase
MRLVFVGDSLTEGRPGSSYVAVLRQKLPGHTLVNLGRGNDTVISLYRRLAKHRFDQPFDLAFLWVGVNDVAHPAPWTFRAINLFLSKPAAATMAEFRAYYRAILNLLCDHAQRVITVSPLLKGEDVTTPWNREVEAAGQVIADLTSTCPQAAYLDLRPVFMRRLAGQPMADYLPRSVLRVAFDALTLRHNTQIDRVAASRGLHVTLDGIHLNSVGANLVADLFLQAIRQTEENQ